MMTALPVSAVVAAVCATFALSGCSVSIDLGDEVTERTETRAFDATAIERLRVETGNGRVSMTAGVRDEIVVTARLRESDEGDAQHVVREDEGTLVVEGRCDGGWRDECSVGFDISLPTGLDVDVETDNGQIDVDGIVGSVDLETDNGEIVAQGLSSSDVRARSDNGRIELTFAVTPDQVTASTDNGAIEIRFPDDGAAHEVSTSTDNGSVDVGVRTDPTSDRTITAESDNGSIVIGYVS